MTEGTIGGATTEPDPGVESNPGEFAVVWNRKSEDERAEMLHNMRGWRDRGERCWREDHERQIAEQRARIAAREAVIRAALTFDGQQTVDGVTDLGYLSPEEWREGKIAAILEMAPSVVLDQMIRDARREAEAERDAVMLAIIQATSGPGDGPTEAEMIAGVAEALTLPAISAARERFDQMIREAKADGWDERHALTHAWSEDNPYRNGDA